MTPAVEKPLAVQANTPAIPWATLAWFSVLIGACYLPVIVRLVGVWSTDEDMGHGYFVPVRAGYIAWRKRNEFLAEPAHPAWMGLALVLYSGLQLCVATLGAELFLARTALIASITGAVWFLGGTGRLRVMAFPLSLLLFMVPIPALIYNQITFPLQLLASRAAEFTLMQIGIPVLREGNILELAGERLSVVDACSGIRSLLSLSFLSLVYGYFLEKKTWLRVVLFFATVPIAMLANAGRVTLTGVLSAIRPEYAHGFLHSASGLAIFMAALAILAVFHQLVNTGYRIVHDRR
jgi:exosortase